MSDEDFEPFVGGPPPDPSERTWRHPSEVAAQAQADAAAELASNRRGLRAIAGWRPSNPSTALIAGSLGAAACLTAIALFQVGTGSNEPSDIASPTPIIETGSTESSSTQSEEAESGEAGSGSVAVDSAAAAVAAPTTTAQPSTTVTVSVSVAPTIAPAVAAMAEERLVQIMLDTNNVATGVLADGYLITSASAVGNRLSVSYSQSDRSALAYLVGVDPFSDLAVFRSSAESRAGRALEALSTSVEEGTTAWADGGAPIVDAKPGDGIVSISMTENGLESSAGLVIAVEHNGMTSGGQPLIGLIDTSIRRPDRPGSVLIGADGTIVGIVVDTDSSLASAVPIDDATSIADRLAQQGWANETWIGFVGIDQANGVEVIDVTADGPADNADLRPGDVIRYLDGARIDHMGGITAGLRRAEPGDMIAVVVERDGELAAMRIHVMSYEEQALSEPIGG